MYCDVMRAMELKSARERKGLSQAQAASRLGVAQSYVAMLESGRRPLTPSLAGKARGVLGLSPVALPPRPVKQKAVDPQVLALQVAALGYPGFAYLRHGRRYKNPAEVVLTALVQRELEARLVEALPWLLVEYSNMDQENQDWLVQQAKSHDLQNRLGFLASLAGQVAERTKPANDPSHEALRSLREKLEKSRLAQESTLGKAFLSEPERRWLEQNRPQEAKHWHLLTDWQVEMLQYANR
jgi:transcriptional regulator with XRE-family HTH domain